MNGQLGQANQSTNVVSPFASKAKSVAQIANPLVAAQRDVLIEQAKGNGTAPVAGTPYKLTALKATFIPNVDEFKPGAGYTIVRGTDSDSGQVIYFNIMDGQPTEKKLARAMFTSQYQQLHSGQLNLAPQVGTDFWASAVDGMNIEVTFTKDFKNRFDVIDTVVFF